MKNKTLEVLIGALDNFISDNQIHPASAVGAAIYAVDAEARAELERRQAPITRERLLREGPWQTIGGRGSVSVFVRIGVSIVVRFDPVTGGRIATILEVSSGSSSPEVNLYSMADLDDLMRLYSHPALPSLMFSNGEHPNT